MASTVEGTVTGTVAPHESNEVRLVLGGLKPLAAIEKAKDAIGYALAVALAGTGALSIQFMQGAAECIVTTPANKFKLDQYQWLLKYGVENVGLKEYHRRMGRLFGYTEKDINAYIEADIHCECQKCTGKGE